MITKYIPYEFTSVNHLTWFVNACRSIAVQLLPFLTVAAAHCRLEPAAGLVEPLPLLLLLYLRGGNAFCAKYLVR